MEEEITLAGEFIFIAAGNESIIFSRESHGTLKMNLLTNYLKFPIYSRKSPRPD